jgi:excinuclease ABC subunit C
MIPRIARIEALVCASEHEAAWLERNVLEHRLPSWNRTRGVESPIYLCLNTSSSAPGLRAEYRPCGGCFGPYLGGLKARQAVTALHRVLPLAYAGEALTAAEKAMAGVRGIGPPDRSRLIEGVVAVLERQPSAVERVRGELRTRRDEAAAVEAFELAGKIQGELAAIDWITAPQRVTSMTAADHSFAAWSGGVHLRFEVRGGRLCDWRQAPAAEAGAGTSGLPAWALFAERNAAMAATLAIAAG